MKRSRCLPLLALALSALACAALPARAGAELEIECFSNDLDAKIRGCTALLERGNLTPDERASLYANRALALSMKSWYAEAIKATWRSPQDIKDQSASASICGNNRVVFNVGGNKCRLLVEVQYQAGIVWVKFVGTHAQYDRIDAETANDH